MGNGSDVGVEVANAANVVISGNTIQSAGSAGVAITTSGEGGSVQIFGHEVFGNEIGVNIAGSAYDTTDVDIQYNSTCSNDTGVACNGPQVKAKNNW